MNNKEIAENLIKLRGNKTQSEVAAAVGISVSALSNYEQGTRIPRDEIKKKIAQFYNKKIEDIFFSHIDHETCTIE